jgi:hypothetical protein
MPEKSVAKMRVKRVGVMSYAKISTIIMAIIGLFLGIFYAVIYAVLGPSAMQTAGAEVDPLMTIGPLVIIIMPIIYAIMGFIMGVIGAWLYNLIAKWVGGVQIELEK